MPPEHLLPMTKIGVFDSGIGGLGVARAIEQSLPALEVVFRHDTPAHFPYATKTPDEIYGYVTPVIGSLVADGCELVVVACNTVSTTLIGRLRAEFSVPFIAVEPMIKPAAALTKTGIIAVCATPTTLTSQRYQSLKSMYAQGVTVLEPDCTDWSAMIERNQMTVERLRSDIMPCLAQGADVLVLGCTHYHWIEQDIKRLVGETVQVVLPETAIISRLQELLSKNEVKHTSVKKASQVK